MTFEGSTRFRDSIEGQIPPQQTAGGGTADSVTAVVENVRGLPGQSGAGGRRAQSAGPRHAQESGQAGRDGGRGRAGDGGRRGTASRSEGNRALRAVAAAAEEAARLMSGVRISSTAARGVQQQRRHGRLDQHGQVPPRPAGSSVAGAAVRYQTHIAAGGAVYTFALSPGEATAAAAGRSLVSQYLSTGPQGGATGPQLVGHQGKQGQPSPGVGRDATAASMGKGARRSLYKN